MLWRGAAWPRPARGQVARLAVMGLFGIFLYTLCFFTALQTLPAGRASLLSSLQPAIIFLGAAALWGDRVTPLKIAGLLLSFCGTALVLAQGNPLRLFETGLSRGDLWVGGCIVSWVTYTLVGRTVMGQLPPLATTAYSAWFGTLLLTPFAIAEPLRAGTFSSPALWAAAAFLGLCGTSLAFYLFLEGVAKIGPGRASIFMNLVPVAAVVLSALLLGESLTAATVGGGAVVILGVRLINW